MKLLFSAKKRFLITLIVFQVSSLVAVLYTSRLLGQFVDATISNGLSASWVYLVWFAALSLFFYFSRTVSHYFFHNVLFDIRLKLLMAKLQTTKTFEVAHNEARIYVYDYIFAMFGVAWVTVSLIATVVIMALSSWILAVVLLFIFVLCYFVPKIYSLQLESLKKQKLAVENKLTELLNRFEQNAPTISLRGSEMAKLAAPSSLELSKITAKVKRLTEKRNAFTSIIIGIIGLSISIAAAILIYYELTTIGNLLAASALAVGLTQQIPGLTSNLADVKNNRWITKVKDEPNELYEDSEAPFEVLTTLTAKEINKLVDQKAILKLSALSVEGPASVLIKGPNGAGKTTLARIIAGLDLDHAGSVLFNKRSRQVYANESVIYQASSTSLIAGTVRDNIIRFAKVVDEARLSEVVTALGISALLMREVTNLSAGEVALVKIAAMLYAKVGLRIYDEVFANLDAARREEVISYALSHKGINIVIAHHAISHQFTQVVELVKAPN